MVCNAWEIGTTKTVLMDKAKDAVVIVGIQEITIMEEQHVQITD
jgi:hypothetical protein